jgi:UDP-3-O-[3-hydroxymyristoyl] N-acetylglucosamine deacetylase
VRLSPSLARADARRCTALRLPGGPVGTVEHLLAALGGLGVRDAALAFSGPEVPILDGSALPWVEAILGASEEVDEAPGERPVRLAFSLAAGAARYRVAASRAPLLRVAFAVPHPCIGRQRASWDGEAKTFAREVAPARTFALLEEVEALLAAGLARGGDLGCAVVFGPGGPLGGPLRFPDEPVRHKLLDLVGDLVLLGALPAARVVATCPAHAANRLLALEIRRRERAAGRVGAGRGGRSGRS